MSSARLADNISHMLTSAEQATSYIDGLGKVDFLSDKRTQQAVILNLLVIGEVATKVINDHAEFANRHAEIPWKSMKGMRNRIAHGYFDIDLNTVWETVTIALPPLIKALRELDEPASR